jgi:ribulose-5-phosphate 4-epimerase/fuculose-1-phosphate aldolase
MTATMTDREPSALTAYTPSRDIAPPLPELNARQQLAALARVLYREGYDDHLAGHITYKQPDGTFLVNPFGLTWDELRASDVMRIDADGHTIEGPWTVTPAITLHVELHRARPDLAVAVHNHPRWSTIWADIGRAPETYDQTSALFHGDVAVYADYRGAVDAVDNARDAVRAMGTANVALLANHGVLVAANDLEQAYLRSMAFEWRCRQAWHVQAAGGGVPMPAEVAARFGEFFNSHTYVGLFPAMVRRELRRDPGFLQ